jgi:hypothetical protein
MVQDRAKWTTPVDAIMNRRVLGNDKKLSNGCTPELVASRVVLSSADIMRLIS